MAFPHIAPLIWQQGNLPHTAVLQKMHSTRDSLGGDQKSWTTVNPAMKCFMQDASRQAKMEFQSRLGELTHKCYYDDSEVITPDFRIVLFSREYKVLATSAATVNLYPHLNCAWCEVKDGDIDITLP